MKMAWNYEVSLAMCKHYKECVKMKKKKKLSVEYLRRMRHSQNGWSQTFQLTDGKYGIYGWNL